MADKKISNAFDQMVEGFDHERARILVVDDNLDLLKLMSIRLRPLKFNLRTTTSAEEALNVLAVWPADLVITDLQLPGMSGMELFEQINRQNPLLPVIILTAHGTIPEAVRATQAGVSSYLTKPFDSETLIKQIHIALLTTGFQEAETIHTDYLIHDDSWRENIVSVSPKFKKILHELEILAETDDLIILEGENGVGKDEVARALHRRSNRDQKPLIEINCAYYNDEMLEAEVFGIAADPDKGISARLGRLQEAHEGTILFSDYNEASDAFFRKFLHAMIDGKATPINSSEPYPVDIRALATTSAIIRPNSKNQEFWDLSYKLGLSTINIPPLRDRREDIPALVKHYASKTDATADKQFSPAAMRILTDAEWPGNIQQLINVVRQCIKLSNTQLISESLVASRIQSPLFKIAPLSSAAREFERNYLVDVLKVTRGNVTRAAVMAKRNRTEFHRLLKKHKIEAKSFRTYRQTD